MSSSSYIISYCIVTLKLKIASNSFSRVWLDNLSPSSLFPITLCHSFVLSVRVMSTIGPSSKSKVLLALFIALQSRVLTHRDIPCSPVFTDWSWILNIVPTVPDSDLKESLLWVYSPPAGFLFHACGITPWKHSFCPPPFGVFLYELIITDDGSQTWNMSHRKCYLHSVPRGWACFSWFEAGLYQVN